MRVIINYYEIVKLVSFVLAIVLAIVANATNNNTMLTVAQALFVVALFAGSMSNDFNKERGDK